MGRFDDGAGPMEYMVTKSGGDQSEGESSDKRGSALKDEEKSLKRMLMARAAMRRC